MSDEDFAHMRRHAEHFHLLLRSQLSLVRGGVKMSARESRAHRQFAWEYAEQMKCTRDVLAAARSKASEKSS